MSIANNSSNFAPPSPALLLDDASTIAARNAAASATTAIGNDGVGENSAPATRVVIHPLVLFHVLDHHTRRQESNSRVIGTLLGRRVDDGTAIEVTNSFAVPHAERGDEVAIGKDFNKTMLSLHNRTNRKEAVVGWYATATPSSDGASSSSSSALIPDTSSLIHEFYAGESDDGDPIHLVVDTGSLASPGCDSLPIRAYRNVPVVVQGEQLGNLFHEIRLELKSNESETICLHEMIKSSDQEIGGGGGENGNKQQAGEEDDSVDALQVSMEKLYGLLDSTLAYVDSVVDGNTNQKSLPDPEVGRRIADTLATIPRINTDAFDKIFHDSLQDLLMVTYLSNLTRTQITIAEKLNASLGGV